MKSSFQNIISIAILITLLLIVLPPASTGGSFHNISIDGDLSDWQQDELMDVSSSSKLYLTWNASYLFIAVSDQDWRDNDLDHAGEDGDLMIYFDTVRGGSAQSDNWDGINTLPFEADWLFTLEDNLYYNLRNFNQSTSNWDQDIPYTGTIYSGNSANNRTEISIAWADIGSPGYFGLTAYAKWEDSNTIWGVWPPENPTGSGPLKLSHYYFFPSHGNGISPSGALVLNGSASALVVNEAETANTNTVWAEVYPGTSADNNAQSGSDGSQSSMTFYFTLDGTEPTVNSARIAGIFDGQAGINGNNDKYYAIIPANRDQSVKWFALGNASSGGNNSSTVRMFISSIPFWIGSNGEDPDTNTIWSEVNPGSSADNNAQSVSDGSQTSITFYYTVDGSNPTLGSTRVTGIFDRQNGTYGNNDKYYAIIPASHGQTVKWFSLGNASNGAFNISDINYFISKTLENYAWIGSKGTDPDTNTVWADVYPGTSPDDNGGTVSDGSLSSMTFHYTLNNQNPTVNSPKITGIFDGQNATNGNNDKYYAIIPASRGQTVKCLAVANSSTGGVATSSVFSFISKIPLEESWVGSEGMDPDTNTVWADVYPGASADDDLGTVSTGSGTSVIFYYTLDGSAPSQGSSTISGIFDRQNGTNGNNDKYYAVIPASRDDTVKWFVYGIGKESSGISGNVFQFVSEIGEEQLDTDGDGTPDTLDDDDDDDGMPDYWENSNGLDPLDDTDALKDLDDDGLSNLEEYTNGTLPNNADTDGDGIPDGWEISHEMNPLDSGDAVKDPDEDDLSNLGEFLNGTNLRDADSDQDGMPDGWEVANGLAPLTDDAAIDSDSDGYTNFEEYLNTTDPWDKYSFPSSGTGDDDSDDDSSGDDDSDDDSSDDDDSDDDSSGDDDSDDDSSGDDDSDDDTPGDDDSDDDTSVDDDVDDDTKTGDNGDKSDKNKKSIFGDISTSLIIAILAVVFTLVFVLVLLFVRLTRIRRLNQHDDELGYDEEKHLENVYSEEKKVPKVKTEAVENNEIIEELEILFNDYLDDDFLINGEVPGKRVSGKKKECENGEIFTTATRESSSSNKGPVSGQAKRKENKIIMKPLKRKEITKPVKRKPGTEKLDHNVVKIFKDE